MSEYQYYEFLALDQPLTEKQMREVRSFSTRARITPTSFVNEYNWGNFKGDVASFMTKYYDAFVYVANWGTHNLCFRLPKAGVDVERVRQYCVSDETHLRQAGSYAIVSLSSQDEPSGWEEGEGWMSSLAPLRADLLAGDYRCLYLGWLNGVGRHEVDDDDIEPPVPPGLAELTAPLRALAEFLRIDDSLIEAAAEASPPLNAEGDSTEALQAWIAALPVQEKDALLFRLTQEPPAIVQREILRRFRQVNRPRRDDTSSARR
ncbi:MAG: hypothetical protein GX601_06280, partial [Anaerolineales bacterium]|nr:hypothetical protein [Anaerolineales bacterium]